MGALRIIAAELVGLIIDDGRFAGAIVIWLAIVGLGLSPLQILRPWNGAILFVGLAATLVESVVRKVRK